MKYDVTYACGHTGVVDLIGPNKNREYKLSRLAGCECPDCVKAKHDAENERAAAASAGLGLPELKGSEKQVSWANTIRMTMNETLEQAIDTILRETHGTAKEEKVKKTCDLMTACWNEILKNVAASWWIDNRTSFKTGTAEVAMSMTGEFFRRWARDNEESYQRAVYSVEHPEEETMAQQAEEEKNHPEESAKEAAEETVVTVAPEISKTSVVASVRLDDESVILESPKSDVITLTCKQQRMRWNGSAWVLSLDATTGEPGDRLAEIANALLRNGAAVKLPKEYRDAAVSATFAPRNFRWVTYLNRLDRLTFRWGEDEDFYTKIKRISGAEFNREIHKLTVPASAWKEVEDFASVHGFGITLSARERIDREREAFKALEKVSPAEPKPAEASHALQDILESSREVLSDLIDEDQ